MTLPSSNVYPLYRPIESFNVGKCPSATGTPLRIQHESCRLPNTSLAAIYGLAAYHQCTSFPPAPRAKTSRRLAAQETAVGESVIWPPRLSEPKPPPAYHQCTSSPPAPRAKTSRRLAAQETTVGTPLIWPPRRSEPKTQAD